MPTNNVCTTFENNHSPAFSHSPSIPSHWMCLCLRLYIGYVIFCTCVICVILHHDCFFPSAENPNQSMFVCIRNLLVKVCFKIARNALVKICVTSREFGDNNKIELENNQDTKMKRNLFASLEQSHHKLRDKIIR